MDESVSSRDELEAAAAEIVGRLVFELSTLEFNLGLCLRGLVAGPDVEAANSLVERLSFKNKLDSILEVVAHRFSATPACVEEFKQWHKEVDAARMRRNDFVHGRWGYLVVTNEIVNVPRGIPGPRQRSENRYTVEALRQELSELQELVARFSKLRNKWHV
jgi:hypothetical protein